MPLEYKIDVMKALKASGFSTYKIRNEKILAESTLQSFRKNKPISWDNLETLCKILNLQPGDILEYTPD